MLEKKNQSIERIIHELKLRVSGICENGRIQGPKIVRIRLPKQRRNKNYNDLITLKISLKKKKHQF